MFGSNQANFLTDRIQCPAKTTNIMKPKDLVEIPKNIKDNMEIISVKSVAEVLKHALVKELKPIKWAEIDQVSNKNKQKSEVTSTH